VSAQIARMMLPARFALLATETAVVATATATVSTTGALLRLRLVDCQPPTLKLLLIECLARCVARIVGHLHEPKSSRSACRMIADQLHRFDWSEWRKQLLNGGLVGIEREITYIDSHAQIL
jgi:hypothetical protein